MKESLEREILVVQHILHQLKRCLAIYYKAKMHDEFRVTITDIQKVEAELKKLNAAKDSEKGAAANVGEKRSGEIIS